MAEGHHAPQRSATAVLANFVTGATLAVPPPRVRHHAKQAVMNYAACALEAANDPAIDAAIRVTAPFSGPATASVIGRRERLDPMAAAFVNAIAGNFLDYDDTHFPTAIHPTAPVAAAALAFAEHRQVAAVDALFATLLGIEVCCRIGHAVSPGHYARGWHITATCGVFGAAAAGGRLLQLTGGQLAAALGLAASQSGGIIENLPTAAKNLGVGNAARHGLQSALFAEAGYKPASLALEGVHGWARAMGDTPDLDLMLDGLGERWEAGEVAFKPYPAGFVFHAEIDACLELRRLLDGAVDDIAEVVVRGDQLLLDRGERPVRNERDARVSIQHAAAVAFVRGRAGVDEFTLAAVEDPALQAFRARVRSALDPDALPASATVTARTAGGRVETVTVRDARGSPRRPLTDADLEAKLREGAARAGLAHKADEMIDRIWTLDEAEGLAPLMGALTP
jgi:2-methylcitrate dehydratase PrpD